MEELNNGDVYFDTRAESAFVVGGTADFWLPHYDDQDFEIRPKGLGYSGCIYQGPFNEIFEKVRSIDE